MRKNTQYTTWANLTNVVLNEKVRLKAYRVVSPRKELRDRQN